MRSAVEYVIYLYLTVCVLLLVFNILYIARSKWIKHKRADRIAQWEKKLDTASENGRYDSAVIPDGDIKKLHTVENLTAFFAVLSDKVIPSPDREAFFRINLPAFQKLALHYARQSAMQRAFLAYVIASFRTRIDESKTALPEILLGYLEDSTVFCRENVLHALYAVGHERAVEHAFDILNEHGWYHNPKLLSDGLVTFTGDRASLVRRLWKRRDIWENSLSVGVVQFASMINAPEQHELDEMFAAELGNDRLDTEIRFAIVRYFGKRRYEPVRGILISMLDKHDGDESQLAIAASAALASYPGEDTDNALKSAITSRNWYVRRNAALSLTRLGLTDDEREEIKASGDRYAYEMLEYAESISAPKPVKGKEAAKA